jgi:hypothetical protein
LGIGQAKADLGNGLQSPLILRQLDRLGSAWRGGSTIVDPLGNFLLYEVQGIE